MIMLSFARFMTENPAISSMAGEIRPVQLGEGICDPAIVYALMGKTHQRMTNSKISTLRRARIAMNVYSAAYVTVREMANTIRNELEEYVGDFGDHTAKLINFDSEVDGFEPNTKLYTVSQQIEIWYHDPDT